MMDKKSILRPGSFSLQVAADSRRMEFDYKNEVIVNHESPVDFVFIGDSITHFWELNAYFGGRGRLILNRGIGGDSTEYVLKRFEADVIQLKPRHAILKIGVNDTWKLEDDPWQRIIGTAPDVIQESIVSNIRSIIGLAARHRQSLILCSILPTNVPSMLRNRERNMLILRVNAQLKVLAGEAGILYVDYHTSFAGSDGLTLADGLSFDGVHPHVAGYDKMAAVLTETLASHGIEI